MEIVILPTPNEVAHTAADVVDELVRSRPSVLGLATGSTPLETYRELTHRHQNHALSFAGTHAFLLDEYVGLPKDHPQSYHSVIRKDFVDSVDFAGVQGLNGMATDSEREAQDYEDRIAAAGGIDLQILGLGSDAHVGFNEPMSSLASRTRIKTLTAQTRSDNSRFFNHPEEVPKHVLTQGLGTIREARHLLLLATGESKALAVAASVEGPVSALFPASVLQLHPHVTVILDEPAASRLAYTDYYAEIQQGKPDWQSY